MVYRSLEKEDIPQVWDLFVHLRIEGAEVSFAEIESKEIIKSWVDNPAQLTYVAMDDDHKLLGVVRGKREMTDEKKHAAFLTAAIHPDARGKGLAAELTNFSLSEMNKRGVTIARIYVYSDNSASLHAIEKLGFTLGGKVLMHHMDLKTGLYVDDIIFHKML
ncbi:MAG: GNAT family N-acetyltransferase [Clostridiales bacterium]|nr:GNAT family N-acetyltransferase [Clostridiales bacterium]